MLPPPSPKCGCGVVATEAQLTEDARHQRELYEKLIAKLEATNNRLTEENQQHREELARLKSRDD